MCLTPKIVFRGKGITSFNAEPLSHVYNPLNDLSTDNASSTDNCTYADLSSLDSVKSDDSSLLILQLNIRGLLNKQSEIAKLLHLGSQNKVNAALLCETWLRQETLPLVKIPGYNFISKARKGKKGGGVGILIHCSHKYQLRPDLEIDCDSLEHIVVKIKGDRHNILLSSCYRAPNTDQSEFLEGYNKLLQKLKRDCNNVVIGLDHKLDLLKSDRHHNTHEFLESNLRNDMLPSINIPTRITNDSATLTDTIFLSQQYLEKTKNYVIIDDTSDHLPCLCVLTDIYPTKKKEHMYIKCRLNEKNVASIIEDIENKDWKKLLKSDSTCEDMFNNLHNTLISTLDKHAPEKLVKTTQRPLAEPWLTKGLRKYQMKQRLLYKKTLLLDNQTVTMKNVEMYKCYRATLQQCK